MASLSEVMRKGCIFAGQSETASQTRAMWRKPMWWQAAQSVGRHPGAVWRSIIPSTSRFTKFLQEEMVFCLRCGKTLPSSTPGEVRGSFKRSNSPFCKSQDQQRRFTEVTRLYCQGHLRLCFLNLARSLLYSAVSEQSPSHVQTMLGLYSSFRHTSPGMV